MKNFSICIFLLCVTFRVHTAHAEAEQTRLRLSGKPEAVWVSVVGRTRLESASIELRNAGEVAASGV